MNEYPRTTYSGGNTACLSELSRQSNGALWIGRGGGIMHTANEDELAIVRALVFPICRSGHGAGLVV